jgi:DNA-binding CsgD family transcriptional regulator
MVREPDATMQPAPQDNQLMSKHRVLSFKPQLRLEWRGQDGQNETEQPDHSASLGDSITSSTRIRFSVYTTALIVHLIPVRRSAHDVFGPAMGILVATPLGSSQTLSGDLLNGLFDLSPAEIRAAQGLLAGKSIDDLAADLGLSRETIRSQVKAVLAKTGTSRQADLMALLSNVNTPDWHAKP